MMLQLNPSIPLRTPKGDARAIVLIDYGEDQDLVWVCFVNATGECWAFQNQDVRQVKNITMHRD